MSAFTHVNTGASTGSIKLTELSDNGDDSVVDWVFVELRSKTDTTVQATQSGLVQRDGDIIDTTGTVGLTFNLPADNYFVAVRHRNHLGVMNQKDIALSSTATVVDFRISATNTHGNHAQKEVDTGIWALWGGDTNQDARIIYSGGGTEFTELSRKVLLDQNNVQVFSPSLPIPGYAASDVNMDGATIYAGQGTDQTLISSNVLLHPENAGIFSPTHFFIQQIPE